jgi:ribosomal silencing factor RsfS
LLGHLKDTLKPLGEEFIRVEENDEWSVIDLGDIFIHLMSKSCKEKYQLEEFLTTQYNI